MNICVFCSANERLDADFYAMAEALGRWIAAEGHTLVFGGNDSGLMHSVSLGAHEGGGRVVGVVPRLIEQRGKLSPYLDVHIPTETLSDRKDLMELRSDAFVVLPGGIGTLDELFSMASAQGLGYHSKPIILYNMKGFWDSLIRMMDDLEAKGVIRGHWRESLLVAQSLDDVGEFLQRQ